MQTLSQYAITLAAIAALSLAGTPPALAASPLITSCNKDFVRVLDVDQDTSRAALRPVLQRVKNCIAQYDPKSGRNARSAQRGDTLVFAFKSKENRKKYQRVKKRVKALSPYMNSDAGFKRRLAQADFFDMGKARLRRQEEVRRASVRRAKTLQAARVSREALLRAENAKLKAQLQLANAAISASKRSPEACKFELFGNSDVAALRSDC